MCPNCPLMKVKAKEATQAIKADGQRPKKSAAERGRTLAAQRVLKS